MAYTSQNVLINNTSWTLIAASAEFLRLQNKGGGIVYVYFGTSQPDAADDRVGEAMLPYSVLVREDMASRSISCWARAMDGNPVLARERDQ